MSDFASVTINAQDIEDIELAGMALMRLHEQSKSLRLLALALRFREQSGLTTETFACNVDESAGMEEFSKRVGSNVVEMSDYWGVSGRSA